jgi:Zn-dependent protease
MAGVAAVALRALSGAGLLDGGEAASQMTSILVRMVQLNVLLAVFNMLPIPPLDGGNVLAGLLRGPASTWFDRIRPYGFMLLYVLLFSGTLPALIDRPSNLILSVLL